MPMYFTVSLLLRLQMIYLYSEVFERFSISYVALFFINKSNITTGNYDNVKDCKYEVPDYWTIGEVYERLIEDVTEGNIIDKLIEVYNSWISDAISNYNSDFFYQSRDYIRECYKEQDII